MVYKLSHLGRRGKGVIVIRYIYMKRLRKIIYGCLILVTFFSFVGLGTVYSSTEEDYLDLGEITLDAGGDVSGGIVPAGRGGNYSPEGYGTCEAVELANNVIKFLFAMSTLFAVIVFVYAGFLMVSSRGDVGQVQKAKGMFTNVIIGFVIMLAAFLIVNTVLGMLLGTGSKALNWQTLECSYAYKAGEAKYEIELTTVDVDAVIASGKWINSGGLYGGGGGQVAVGGSCGVRTSGACSVDNLRPYFGNRAEEASQICSKESGGAPVKSRSDICCGSQNPADCRTGKSFSGGYFQINILAHGNDLGCGRFYERNGTEGAQGNCIMRNAKGICIGWSCKITNNSAYEACMAKTMNRNTNFEYAGKLFRKRGFNPWAWSAKLCNIPQH